MFNGRAENSRSLTAPLPAPRFVAWWVWSAVGFAGLIAALASAGSGRRAWDGPLGFIGQIFGGLGAVFQPGAGKGASIGARLAFFLGVLLLLYVLWRATRAWLAYKPGAVDVQQLQDATPEGTPKPSDADLTAKLRRRLSDSSMYPPATLPAQAPAESFLELLGDIEIDPDKLGTALPKMLGRLRPKLAYRVGGLLQFRDTGPDQYGMTITVTAFLFGGSRATTVWGSDWDDVIRKAGNWIVSTLLPVTRAGRLPPWRQWWGREIKPELYEAYQEANELSRAGRHHEALEQYFTAIRLDPTNSYLRAELAETQEKMGLHIDALDTCQRALTLDGQDARTYRKRLWQSRWIPHWRRLRYFRHPHLYRDLLGLRYRNSIILGTSEMTARQWCRRMGTNGSHTHEQLIPLLVDRYWQTAIGLDDTDAPRKRSDRKQVGKESLRHTLQHSTDEKEIRLVFQRAALQETARLAADDAWARFWLYWPIRVWSCALVFWPAAYYQSVRGSQQPVSRGAFRVNRKVWAPLRLEWANWEYQKDKPSQKWRRHYAWRRPGRRMSWRRVKPTQLRRRLRLVSRRRSRRDWLTRYNTACVYAVAMNAQLRNHTQQQDLTQLAIEQLENAALTTRGSFAVVERTWMVEEDPDLAPLRNQDLFNDFVRTVYPSAEAFEQTSPSMRSDEQLREYDYRLLKEIAKVMQQVWNQRGEGYDVGIQCATEWLRIERKIWRSLQEISDDANIRKWQDRVSLIRYIQANCQPASASSPGFPPPLAPEEAASPNGLPDAGKIHRTLSDLKQDMDAEDAHSLSDEGQRVLREAAADGVTRLNARTTRLLATGYAAAWQTLDDCLELEVQDHQPFRQALKDVPQLTRRVPTPPHGRRLLPV
ncbi:tetratricopeptide repeat protein [Streptomyces sp. NPDC059008]|uniref:tetratricopeptide repeat protein n=1 Tax=Streptomyces sp. NPDC059008 TaxID=3346693 RepID=UPI00367EFA83